MNRKIIGSLFLVSTLLLAGCSSSASTSSSASSTAVSSATPTPTATPVSHQVTFGNPDTILQKVAAATSVFPDAAENYCQYNTQDTEIYASRENDIQYCGRHTSDFKSAAGAADYGWEVSVGNNAKGVTRFYEAVINEFETSTDETYEILVYFNTDGTRTLTFCDSSIQGKAQITFDKEGNFLSVEKDSTQNEPKYPAMTADNFKLLTDKGTEILAKAGMTWSDIVDESALKYYATEYMGE